MFRGSVRAKLDEKGRLKLPSSYLGPLLEKFGPQLFITSLDGMSAIIYPLKKWMEIEDKLSDPASLFNPDFERFRLTVNYWGREGELDSQGRIVIHSPLREAAQLDGDCVVMGDPSGHLTLLAEANAAGAVAGKPLTRKERMRVARMLSAAVPAAHSPVARNDDDPERAR